MFCAAGERAAHRVALELKLGRELAPGEVARHTCHERRCCNPAHLLPGSIGDNNADTVAAGRHAFGEASGTAKLTEEQVLSIRETGHAFTYESQGARHGVTGKTIANVVQGKRWRHLLPAVRP